MKKKLLFIYGTIFLVILIIVSFLLYLYRPVSQNAGDYSQTTKPSQYILENYSTLPLHFEENYGQADSRVKFLSRGNGYEVFLTPAEVALVIRKLSGTQKPLSMRSDAKTGSISETNKSVIRLQLVSPNRNPRIVGVDELPGKVNYLIGNDQTYWQTNIPTYAKVKYQNVYNGIDLVFYGNRHHLEYDFIVSPGAKPDAITFTFEGIDKLQTGKKGDLVLYANNNRIQLHKPFIYQETNGVRKEISGSYVLKENNHIAFQVGTYDPSASLVIDPVIEYSTYLGGTDRDSGFDIAVDAAGNTYTTGETLSDDFPIMNPIQPLLGAKFTIDAFVTKINSSGDTLIYSTYLGGSGFDAGEGIAVDAAGSAYVAGWTESPDFPTASTIQPFYGGSRDAFVTKLSPNGSDLIYSTYLGGRDLDLGNLDSDIAVDAQGNAYITGDTLSDDFPIANAVQPSISRFDSPDAFVTKINTTGDALVYSTYLGGRLFDIGRGIAVDGTGNAYITGSTTSDDFPTTAGAFQTSAISLQSVFVTKLSPNGDSLVYSTYLSDFLKSLGSDIAVDTEGHAYVTGWTQSGEFPTQNPLQPSLAGKADAFVVKFSPNGSSLMYSTFLGGSDDDLGAGIVVDSAGNVYVLGVTASTDFPTLDPFQSLHAGAPFDYFVASVNSNGNALIYSTYLGGNGNDGGSEPILLFSDGGIAVDANGNAYITGSSNSTNFPIFNPFQPTYAGSTDAVIVKIESPFGDSPPPDDMPPVPPPPDTPPGDESDSGGGCSIVKPIAVSNAVTNFLMLLLPLSSIIALKRFRIWVNKDGSFERCRRNNVYGRMKRNK